MKRREIGIAMVAGCAGAVLTIALGLFTPLNAQDTSFHISSTPEPKLEQILEIHSQRVVDDLADYVKDHFEMTVGLRKLCVWQLLQLKNTPHLETSELLKLVQAYKEVKQWHHEASIRRTRDLINRLKQP